MTTLVKLYRIGFIAANRSLLSEYIISSASINRAINEAGTFDFSIPIGLLRGIPLPVSGVAHTTQRPFSADLYQDGELLVQGNVDSIGISYIDDEPSYKFSCNSELFDLTRYLAKSTAYYQNEYFLYILEDLLVSAIGVTTLNSWTLGEVVTLEDPTIKTTIDLRGEAKVFGQIMKLLAAVPNTFLRYGERALDGSNRFTFDIGAFNRQVYPPIDAQYITQLNQTVKYSEILRLIQAYGGEITLAGVTRRIDLQDALAYDPTLSTYDSNSTKITAFGLTNDKVSGDFGEYIAKNYDEIVPSVKIDPSVAEINQAGYALYLRAKNDLLQKSIFQSNWTASIKRLPEDFKLGDQIFLRGRASQVFYDNVAQKAFHVDVGDVENWYRVNRYSLQIKDDELTYNLDLATNLRLQGNSDPILDLYDAIKQPVASTDSIYVSPGFVYSLLSFTIPLDTPGDAFGEDADGNTYPAAQILIPLDDPLSGGVTTVSLFKDMYRYDAGVTIRKIENPIYATNTGILAAVSINRDWQLSDTTTVYALIRYEP